MATLLPFDNEIAAHLARSRLLANGIEATVVHDGAATVYGGWVMHPRLSVEDEDLEEARRILAEPVVPLDESFTEPTPPDEPGNDAGSTNTRPES